MSTHPVLSVVTRLIAAAACVTASASCGSEFLRTGRAPVVVFVDTLQAAKGNAPGTFVSPLLSDVITNVEVTVGSTTTTVPTIFNDLGRAVIRAELKDQSGATVSSPLNAVTFTRYRVNYRRSDGRNSPGVDVPFGFDGAVTASVQPGNTAEVIFDLVRHATKSEPPLRPLIGGGGLRFITTVADVTFFGRDQNGNEVMAVGSIDVTFADFGDEE